MADKKNLKLNFQVPSLTFDGHALGGKEKNATELIFFQVRNETDTGIEGQVVASLRMNDVQLKGLRDALDNKLKEADKKTP